MRPILAALLALAVLAPAAASAGPMQECRFLSQRIDFFGARLQRARDLNNEIWEVRLENHLGRMVARRAQICPGYGPGAQAQAAFMELLKLGGQAALTFFTMGMM